MSHLTPEELAKLSSVLLANGSFGDNWLDEVVAALPHAYRTGLPTAAMFAPRPRLTAVLNRLNEDGILADGGGLPLMIFLKRLMLDALQAIVDEAKRVYALLEANTAGGGGAAATTDTLQQALGEMRVAGAALFAGRPKLRGRLRDFMLPDKPPAVAVNGEEKVGKSHTRALLAHAAQRTGSFLLAWVEIRKEQAADFTADWLIEELVRSAVPGASGMPAERQPPPRWHGDLADWAWRQLTSAAGGKPVWIVVDGLGLENVHPYVISVVERLAARAGTPTGPQQLRLVLINCDVTGIRRAGCVTEVEMLKHLELEEAKECLEGLAGTRFPQVWSKVQPVLSSGALTTPMIGALLEEALKP